MIFLQRINKEIQKAKGEFDSHSLARYSGKDCEFLNSSTKFIATNA
jgi:hypothetical protein